MTMLKGYIKSGDSMQAIGSSDIACGTILAYAGNGDIPVGYLLCNGVGVSKTTYPSLFSAIGYTYGGSGDLFNLPDLRDKFIEGATTGGTEKEAGLPNITGDFQLSSMPVAYGGSPSGSFTRESHTGGNTGASSGSYSPDLIKFNASRSNPIYGNSSTVQPPALTMRYIIKAFNGASPSSTDLEITRVANDLLAVSSGKVDKVVTTQEAQGCIKRSVDNSYIRFNGGTNSTSGAGLLLFGKDHSEYAGQFMLDSYTAENEGYRLTGKPNGELTWNEQDIEIVVASGSANTGRYIRYASGLQICWFTGNSPCQYGGGMSFQHYPAGFVSKPIVLATANNPNQYIVSIGDIDVNYVKYTSFDNSCNVSPSLNVNFIAIGLWK